MTPPRGRISSKRRDFHEIVYDMRHVVFAVIRKRPNANGTFGAKALGTGFVAAPGIFLTCDHVINNPDDPHVDGDAYLLASNLSGQSGSVWTLGNPQLGKDILLFPNLDLAVVRVPQHHGDMPFTAVSYAEIYEGQDIGVVGYPIPDLQIVNRNLVLDGLTYRAARGHVTGRYTANVTQVITDVPIVEVNFLFVPGNSGGPVFDAQTGRVLGFVRGFRHVKIWEGLSTATTIPQLPLGLTNQYIASMNAIYSLAFKLDFVRATIESFGVSL